MLEASAGGVRWRVSLLFPALVTVLLFRFPASVVLMSLAASAMHECGHLTAMLVLGCPPRRCTLGAFGMRIEADASRMPGVGKQMVVFAAGPLVNALACVGFWWAGEPTVAAVHGMLGLFNLLPAVSLDGGQLLRCAFSAAVGEERAAVWCRRISVVTLTAVASGAAALALIGEGNLSLLPVCGYLIFLAIREK